MTDYNKRIWFCGIPGSKWSGVDIQLRKALPTDTTDETPDRIFYHRVNTPGDTNNGHRGAYWGPGMGCGEDWTDFNHIDKQKLLDDIGEVFTGEGYKIIKSHFFARQFNLDYIWNHFPGDYMMLLYREPQASFSWWANVMDFGEDHFPDYTPGYKDYNTMRPRLYEENAKMLDFAMRKNMQFEHWNPNVTLRKIPGFNPLAAAEFQKWPDDLYMAIKEIPSV